MKKTISESKYLEKLIFEMLNEDDDKEESKDKKENDSDKEEEDNFSLKSGYIFGYITKNIKDSWVYILNKNGKLPEDEEKLDNFVKTFKEDLNLSEYRICSANIFDKKDKKTYSLFFNPSAKLWMTDTKDMTEEKMKEILESSYWKNNVIPSYLDKLHKSAEMLEKYIKQYIVDGLIFVDEIKFQKVEKTISAPAIENGIKSSKFRL